MQNLINTSGEIELLIDSPKIDSIQDLDEWRLKSQQLKTCTMDLSTVDEIFNDWIDNLTKKQMQKIKRQKSLKGIPIPKNWIIVWRVILKEPNLRNSRHNAKNGSALNSYGYYWNIWAETCIAEYLSDLEKELLYLVDSGYPYSEIGKHLNLKYGDDFWKKRKIDSSTTPEQVVNNYLYLKMPTKIAKSELLAAAMDKIKKNKL